MPNLAIARPIACPIASNYPRIGVLESRIGYPNKGLFLEATAKGYSWHTLAKRVVPTTNTV